MPKAYKVSYYSWIAQMPTTPAEIQGAVRVFADALKTELNRTDPGATVQIQMYPDVPPQIAAVTTEADHIALINPLGLVFAAQRNPAVQAVAVARRKDAVTGSIGPFYRAQIYTSNSAIRALPDIRGHSMGFGSPISTSNFLFPANLLKTNHLLWFASSLSFLGGHPQVAKAVYAGTIDVGAGHDGVIDNLATDPAYGDAKNKLRRLCWISSLPSDPVAVNISDDAERNRVASALVKIGGDAAVMAKAVSVFWGGSVGLAATNTSAYDSIANVMTTLAVKPVDLSG